MDKKIVFILAFIFLLCGCSPAAPQQPMPPSEVTQPGGFSMQGEYFSYGADSWQDYIPDDIPPIPADITNIMADENTIRIFFNNMPKDAYENYLALLYQNGFSFEFVVYEQPGVPQEDIERYIREGKYDAVRITKGNYKMYIEYGADMGTYDIDPKGFPEGTEIKNKVEWPAQLSGIMNQPANSRVTSVTTIGERLEISCESENTNLFTDYCAQLKAEGFTEGRTVTDQDYNIISTDYTKGDLLVTLLNSRLGMVGIQYKPGENTGTPQIPGIPTPPALPSENWPETLPKTLPEFTRKILMSMNLNETTTAVQIDAQAAGWTITGSCFLAADLPRRVKTYIRGPIAR